MDFFAQLAQVIATALALLAQQPQAAPEPAAPAPIAAPAPVSAPAAPTLAAAVPAPKRPPALSLPSGIVLFETETGCLPSGECPRGAGPANYYDPATRTVVLFVGQRASTRQHEYCHAHQHAVVLAELGREPTRDLREWAGTAEGRLWTALPETAPWVMSAPTALEDFAETCGRYLTDPEALRTLDAARFALIERILGEWR